MSTPPQPPPGWYRDPDGPGERWWHGAGWGEQRRQAPVARDGGGGGLIVKIALGIVLGFVLLLFGCSLLLGTAADDFERNLNEELSDPAPKKGTLGEALTLEDGDFRLRVTVTEILDPLEIGTYDSQEPGKRYVGVKLEIENVGRQAYDGSPSGETTLVTTGDEQARDTYLDGGECPSSGFASGAKVGSGSSRRGCIPFAVAESADPKTLQFEAITSGGKTLTGEWSLR